MQISEKFGVKATVGAVVGLELEVEGDNLPTVPRGNTTWEPKHDGSLRNGMEYVFRGPRGSVATKEALSEMAELMRQSGFRPSYSFRTSTHVHVNVANLDEKVVHAMVAIFHLFEDEYINYCSRTRRANRFCLGMKDADGVVGSMRDFFYNGRVPNADRGKYAALNLCTLANFGTLEFRCLEGTNDWNRVYTWVRALLALRKAAKELGTLSEVVKMDKEELAKLVFPTERLREQFLKEGWQGRYDLNRSIGWDAFYQALK